MQIVSAEDNLHGMSNHVEIICLKFMSKPVFREKCKKNKTKKNFKMLSAENFIQCTKT